MPLRPAGHPLLLAATTVLAPLGRDAAAEAFRWLALLGAGALVAALWRLAKACHPSAWSTAAIAALLLATRAPLWGFALLGYMDQWAAALVLWAAALEVRQPRRGGAVFVLLGLAGLIRPETWLFAAAYWLWCAIADRRRALRLLPLAAMAPLVWLMWDLATTGTVFGSLTPDPNVPTTSTFPLGVSHAPEALARFLGGFTRVAEAVACAAGIGLALWMRDRRMLMPAALIVLNVAAFVLVAIQRGPLEQRYLLVAGSCALLFAAYAIAQLAGADAAGADEPRHARRAIRLGAACLAIACLVLAPLDVRRIDRLHDQVATAEAADSQLRELLRSPAGRCAVQGRIQVPDIRIRPFVAYWGDASPKQVGTSSAPNSIEPLDPVARELAARSLPRLPRPVSSPAWRLTGSCARQ